MTYEETDAFAWFARQHAPLLARYDRALVRNALPGRYLDAFAALVCQQAFRPLADTLEREGRRVVADTDERFGLIVFFGTRHRDANLFGFARSLRQLRPGGLFVCAMPNALGAARYRKDLAALFGPVQSVSKRRCKVFWAARPDRVDEALLADWLDRGALRRIPGAALCAYPGVFSSNKIDPGSRLLAEALPETLAGAGADLGAGYGYLSHTLLSQAVGVRALHLYEADHTALQAARHNLRPFLEAAPAVTLTFHWHDVAQGLLHASLDWIVTNPPLHAGRHADVELGRAFVGAAAEALHPRGRLYLVANRHLPYEAPLRGLFKTVELLAQSPGFNVFQASK